MQKTLDCGESIQDNGNIRIQKSTKIINKVSLMILQVDI
jgi:hypothetical protein